MPLMWWVEHLGRQTCLIHQCFDFPFWLGGKAFWIYLSIYLHLTSSPIEQLEMSYGQWCRWYPGHNVHPGTLNRRKAGLLGGCYFDTLISMLVGSQNQLETCDIYRSDLCISWMCSSAFSSVSNPISIQMTRQCFSVSLNSVSTFASTSSELQN